MIKGTNFRCSKCGKSNAHPTPIGSYAFLCDDCYNEESKKWGSTE